MTAILNRAAIRGVDRISALEAGWQQVKSIPFTDGKHRGERIENIHCARMGGVDLTAKPQTDDRSTRGAPARRGVASSRIPSGGTDLRS